MLTRRRTWSHARQAYLPRTFPSALVFVPLTMAVSYGIVRTIDGWIGVALMFLAAAAIGLLGAELEWAIWRRRHPPLPPRALAERRLQAMRDAAPWN